MFDEYVNQLGPSARVIVVDAPKAAEKSSELRAEVLACELPDHNDRLGLEQFLDTLTAMVPAPDLIFTAHDRLVPLSSCVSAHFGLPANPVRACVAANNKDECREALRSAGLRQPPSALIETIDEAEAFARRHPGPWIVKPRSGSGSRGVRRVDARSEMVKALAPMVVDGPCVIEVFVSGDEYSAEGIVVNGRAATLAITAKKTTEPPVFIELSHVQPAPIDDALRSQVHAEVAEALRALEVCTGMFHVEFWDTAAGLVVGEIHLRPGGDWIHTLLATTRPDVDVFAALLRGSVPNEEHAGGHAAASRFLAFPPGRLVEVSGWADIEAHPQVLVAELFRTPGDIIPVMRESNDRSGVVVVRADTPQAAEQLAHKLAGTVSCIVEPASADVLVP